MNFRTAERTQPRRERGIVVNRVGRDELIDQREVAVVEALLEQPA